MNEIRKNRFGKITKINNESILNRLDNNVFVTERSINDYVKSFNIYDLNKDELIAERKVGFFKKPSDMSPMTYKIITNIDKFI